MADLIAPAAGGTAAVAVIKGSLAVSVSHPTSMLGSELSDILTGNFVLIGSDITALLGLVFAGLAFIIGVINLTRRK